MRYGQPVFGAENRTQTMQDFPEDEKTYKVYPKGSKEDDEDLLKFSSVILNEEIEGFNVIGSLYTDDILRTLMALNQTKNEPV